MEFYKFYTDDWNFRDGYHTGSSVKKLNKDIENNPQWKGDVINQTTVLCEECDALVTILVRWIGLSTTPFKGDKE